MVKSVQVANGGVAYATLFTLIFTAIPVVIVAKTYGTVPGILAVVTAALAFYGIVRRHNG